MTGIAQVNRRQERPLASTGATQRNQYLTFSLGNETFAMEILYVREVIQYGGLTQIPLMPDFIRGVLNLRGAAVPVIDLSVRFQRSATEPNKRTCVVILELGLEQNKATLGVMVDNVSEVLEIQNDEIEPAPCFGRGLRSEFIQGVGKVAGKFVILLDVNQVVSAEELAGLAIIRESPAAHKIGVPLG